MEDEEAPYIKAEPCPCEKSKSKTVLEKDIIIYIIHNMYLGNTLLQSILVGF